VMGGVGQGMGALDGGRDRRRVGAVLGVNLGRAIVTNRDNGNFVAQLVVRNCVNRSRCGLGR